MFYLMLKFRLGTSEVLNRPKELVLQQQEQILQTAFQAYIVEIMNLAIKKLNLVESTEC